MMALSVRQPWAALITGGDKTIECRTWSTPYRGPLLICSSGPDVVEAGFRFPGGFATAVVELVDVRPMTPADLDAACLDTMPSRPGFAWVFANIVEIEPSQVKGKLKLFECSLIPRPLVIA